VADPAEDHHEPATSNQQHNPARTAVHNRHPWNVSRGNVMGKATVIAAVERGVAPGELRALGVPLLFPRNRASEAWAGDFVDVDANDLRDVDAVPLAQRVITCTVDGDATDGSAVDGIDEMLRIPARLYRIIVRPRGYSDTLLPLRLMHSLRRRDVVAYADGLLGTWTRVLAPHFGAPYIFAKAKGDVATDGVPTVAQLRIDYGLPQYPDIDEIFGIAGDPVFSSLSPRLHNAAFRAMGRRALYVPFHVPSFADFWNGAIAGGALDALGLPIRAICVVSPYKQAALPVADAYTPFVERAQSTNFFVREGNDWTADTTDPAGVMLALRDRGVDVAGLPVAVVGCGGSGRAIAAALQQAGAGVTLVNRGQERASLARRLLHLPFIPLHEFEAGRYALVVNATPVGRGGDALPAFADIREDAVVIDLVYGDRPTPLMAATRARGQITVDGKEILMRQAMSQFLLMTGREMPEGLARDILGMPYEARTLSVVGDQLSAVPREGHRQLTTDN
jgi:3-dehydroquinate dehydratase/shikimate dehydrogenase